MPDEKALAKARNLRIDLHTAIAIRDEREVKRLLKSGVPPDGPEEDHKLHNVPIPPLVFAARVGYMPVVDALLGAGADPNREVAKLGLPLHEACINGHADIAHRLIESGANPLLRSWSGSTAAYFLIQGYQTYCRQEGGHEAALRLLTRLLKAGTLPNIKSGDRACLMQIAIDKSAHEPVLAVLRQHGANLDLRDRDGLGLIHNAAQRDNVTAIRYLLREGVNNDSYDEHGRTALHHCVSADAVHCLLDSGARIDFQDADGLTPLAYRLNTIEKGAGTEAAIALIAAGANLDLPAFNGETPTDILKRRRLKDVSKAVDAIRARNVMRDVGRIRGALSSPK